MKCVGLFSGMGYLESRINPTNSTYKNNNRESFQEFFLKNIQEGCNNL